MARMGFSLHTLHTLDASTAEAVRLAAEAGYEGVEFHNLTHHDMDVTAVRAALDETGVEPLGVQADRQDLRRGLDHIVDFYGKVGVSTLVFHANDENWTERRARDTVELLRRRAIELDDRGWDLLVHPNHMDIAPIVDWPVARHIPWLGVADRLNWAGLLPDGPVYDWLKLNESRFSKGFNILLDHYWHRLGYDTDRPIDALEDTMLARYLAVDSSLLNFELDVAFFPRRGYDPVAVLEYLGPRVEQVHVKDIRVADCTLGRWPLFRPPGDGEVDLQAVIETALAHDVEWLTFEHDPWEVDPTDAMNQGASLLASALEARADT